MANYSPIYYTFIKKQVALQVEGENGVYTIRTRELPEQWDMKIKNKSFKTLKEAEKYIICQTKN